jgi:DNA-binding NarL/FixJ family response regulator
MNPRVIVCDDHPVVRDALTTCLRALSPGCEVGECATAAQVVERLGGPERWDFVVLDLMLPDARGLDALHRVRACAPDIRIAVVSAHDDRDTVERVLDAGAVGFLPKSAEPGRLLDALRRLLDLPCVVGAFDDGVGDDADEAADLAADDGGPRGRPLGAPDGALPGDDWVHDALASLSPRQIQVLRLMVRGLPNKEICRELGLSENTVKIHIGAVLRGLRARNRTEAVSLASRIGFGVG